MNNQPIRYAILRDGRNWDGINYTALQPEEDGVLTLSKIPGTADAKPVLLPAPFNPEMSGIVTDGSHYLYISDTAGDRVIRIDTKCNNSQLELNSTSCSCDAPGAFKAPLGVAVTLNRLYVADSGNKRIQVFLLPSLELIDIWEGFDNPTCLTCDSEGSVYVLDLGEKKKTVLRFSGFGVPDYAYNSVMAKQAKLTSPLCIAIGPDDTLFVSDDKSKKVLQVDKAGEILRELPTVPTWPSAMAVRDYRLYVADAKTGSINIFDCLSNHYIGRLPGYLGPVSAMATSEDGTLYVKPLDDATYYCLKADTAFVTSGSLRAGPIDAGEQCEWERVRVKAQIPQGTEVILKTFFSGESSSSPTESDWKVSPSLDMLLEPYPRSRKGQARFLWISVALQGNNKESPSLLQVQAETIGKSYLDYLPSVYRRDDAPSGFLESWLALFRSRLQDLETNFDEMFRYFDPLLTPDGVLPGLAKWLAFDLPDRMNSDEKRSLMKKVLELYSRRGTVQGLKDFVELYTGVRPLIFEGFKERHIWQLGETSLLGCNTALAPALPDGMIVSGHADSPTEIFQDNNAAGLNHHSNPWNLADGKIVLVGNTVVGESGPLGAWQYGEPLFNDTSHLFSVIVPAAMTPTTSDRQKIKDVLDAEKPAHTDYHLCFVKPQMRIGLQARIGIDTIIAGPPDPMAMSGTLLGVESHLAVDKNEGKYGRVGKRAHLGQNTVIG